MYILGNIGKRLTKTNEKGKTTRYTYDDLNQLTRVEYPDNKTTEYTYDQVGNRTGADGVTYTYNDANRLTQAGTKPYTYDPNGNLMSVGEAVYYNYDNENRLIQLVNGTDTFQYTYDGDGNRESQTVTGSVYGTYQYIYDINAGLPRLVMEKDGEGNATDYLYAGRLYGLTNPEGQFYYHADGLGSISVVSDVYGNQINRYEYDAFGNPLLAEETIHNPFRFTGEPYDASGLTYLRARYYDPSNGRFLTQDSLFGELNDPLSQNLYAYCGNNPVLYVDPSGHISICETETKYYLTGALVLSIVYNDAVEKTSWAVDKIERLFAKDNEKEYKKTKSGVSGKEGSKDIPSWARGERPYVGESGKDFARRLLDDKYGKGNWKEGPGSEYNQLRKYGDRAFE